MSRCFPSWPGLSLGLSRPSAWFRWHASGNGVGWDDVDGRDTTWDTTGHDVQGLQALVALGIRHRNRSGHLAGISCADFEAKRALLPSSPWPNSGFGCPGHLLYVMGSLI